jgi:hypothetical protein
MAAAASATTQTEERVSLKLLVNKETNTVLFAEAGKDFVDVLFSFLTLPLGTIARLVGKDSKIGPITIGCLDSFYQSVANLDNNCLLSEKIKEILLQPKNSSEDYCSTIKLNIDDTQPTEYFIACYQVCPKIETSNCRYFTTSRDKECHGFSFGATTSRDEECHGFVNDVATFVITDNLNVIPNSSGYTNLALIQNSGIKSISSVKEISVNVTKEKVLDLLKCSLLSKSPLTDLFLEKKKLSPERSLFLSTTDSFINNLDKEITITLNLVIKKSDKKILYAQGEKDFADILLSFLTFPLGAIVHVLGENSSLGSLDTLYKSIINLDENKYLSSEQVKSRLVYPYGAVHFNSSHLVLSRPIYSPNFVIGSCNGFVKGPAMYLVTDDLIISSSSPISALYLINHFGTPLNDVKEKVVTIGIKECLNILKASLTSTSALTNGLRHLLTDVKEEK